MPVSCSPASGSTFGAGDTTVKCTTTDAHHNTATSTFTVTVQPYVVLYQDELFGGRQLILTSSVTDLRQQDFNDVTTSVQIFGPIRATFYQDANFGGARSTGTDVDSAYPFDCYNVGFPYQTYWESLNVCHWSFGSPQEIGNDQISSVWITPNTSFDHSSRLVFPAGLWLDATVDASTSYRFDADGTYRHLLHVNGGFYEIDGRFSLGYYVPDLTFPPHWSGNYMDLTDNVLTEYAGGFGGPIISQTPQPDVEYRYQYDDSNHIQILEATAWQPYAFDSDG